MLNSNIFQTESLEEYPKVKGNYKKKEAIVIKQKRLSMKIRRKKRNKNLEKKI